MPLTSVRRYSTPDQEPVVDISISNARHCLYIVGMETVGEEQAAQKALGLPAMGSQSPGRTLGQMALIQCTHRAWHTC